MNSIWILFVIILTAVQCSRNYAGSGPQHTRRRDGRSFLSIQAERHLAATADDLYLKCTEMCLWCNEHDLHGRLLNFTSCGLSCQACLHQESLAKCPIQETNVDEATRKTVCISHYKKMGYAECIEAAVSGLRAHYDPTNLYNMCQLISELAWSEQYQQQPLWKNRRTIRPQEEEVIRVMTLPVGWLRDTGNHPTAAAPATTQVTTIEIPKITRATTKVTKNVPQSTEHLTRSRSREVSPSSTGDISEPTATKVPARSAKLQQLYGMLQAFRVKK